MAGDARYYRGGDDLKAQFLAGKEKQLLESKKWPASFSQRLDITKIQIDAFRPWITRRVTELMGVEDDIVVDYCISQLKFYGEHDAKANSHNAGDGGAEFNEKPYLDPKKFQINLTGFMAKNAKVFVRELWDLLLAAQENEYGIPQAFIDAKKRELEEIKAEAEKIEREIDCLREAEANAKSDSRSSSPSRSRGKSSDNRRRSSRNRYSRSSSRSRKRSSGRSRRDRGEERVTSRRRSGQRSDSSKSSPSHSSSSSSPSPSPYRRHHHHHRTRSRKSGRHYSPSPSSSSSSPSSRSKATSSSRSLSRSRASHSSTSKSHSHSRESSIANRDVSYRKSSRRGRPDYKHRKSSRRSSRSRSSSSRRHSRHDKRRRRRRSYSRSVSSSVDAEAIHRRKRDK